MGPFAQWSNTSPRPLLHALVVSRPLLHDKCPVPHPGVKQLDRISSIQLLMLPHLFPSGTGYLDKGFSSGEKWVQEARDTVRDCADQHVPWLEQALSFFEQFAETIRLKPEDQIAELDKKFEDEGADGVPVSDVQQLIDQTERKMKEIREQVPDELYVGFFLVECKEFKFQLQRKLDTMKKGYLTFLANKKLGILLRDATNAFDSIFTQLRQPVNNIAELTEQQEYIKGLEK